MAAFDAAIAFDDPGTSFDGVQKGGAGSVTWGIGDLRKKRRPAPAKPDSRDRNRDVTIGLALLLLDE